MGHQISTLNDINCNRNSLHDFRSVTCIRQKINYRTLLTKKIEYFLFIITKIRFLIVSPRPYVRCSLEFIRRIHISPFFPNNSFFVVNYVWALIYGLPCFRNKLNSFFFNFLFLWYVFCQNIFVVHINDLYINHLSLANTPEKSKYYQANC